MLDLFFSNATPQGFRIDFVEKRNNFSTQRPIPDAQDKACQDLKIYCRRKTPRGDF